MLSYQPSLIGCERFSACRLRSEGDYLTVLCQVYKAGLPCPVAALGVVPVVWLTALRCSVLTSVTKRSRSSSPNPRRHCSKSALQALVAARLSVIRYDSVVPAPDRLASRAWSACCLRIIVCAFSTSVATCRNICSVV